MPSISSAVASLSLIMCTFRFEMEAGGARNFVVLEPRRLQAEAEMPQLGIVNLAARGMLVVSVARNAHGPNEFLHIPTGKRVSVVIA